jgi:hypothetical protein
LQSFEEITNAPENVSLDSCQTAVGNSRANECAVCRCCLRAFGWSATANVVYDEFGYGYLGRYLPAIYVLFT